MGESRKGAFFMARILEVCVDAYASAMAAVAGGADRLELCSALSVGGLTPSVALLKLIREESSIPIRCLMRTRAGDFLYCPEEIRQMAMEIEALRQAGADGFVIGCLTPRGELDRAAMAVLIQAAGGAKLTLHRCVDVSRDIGRTYLDAGELGIDTVLTSGAAGNCVAGMDAIGHLLKLRDSQGGPEVLIGAGVSAEVIRRFRKALPGARAFHMSGKIQKESGMLFRREGVPMGAPGLDEWHLQQTSEVAVRAARLALDDGTV